MTIAESAARLSRMAMRNSRISATWLSDEMAHALAAMWPPLDVAAVKRAADELTAQPGPPRGVYLVRSTAAAHEEIEPRVVEALRALHDLGA